MHYKHAHYRTMIAGICAGMLLLSLAACGGNSGGGSGDGEPQPGFLEGLKEQTPVFQKTEIQLPQAQLAE